MPMPTMKTLASVFALMAAGMSGPVLAQGVDEAVVGCPGR